MALHPDQIRLSDLCVQGEYDCPASIAVGDPAYLASADAVDLADCLDADKMPAEGIVSRKITATRCVVVTHGSVKKSGWSLDPDNEYFVGSGHIVKSNNIPISFVMVQSIGWAKNTGELTVDTRGVTVR